MSKKDKAAQPKKYSVKEFVLRMIDKLKNEGYNSIHVVYSGGNQAFTEYFGYKPFEKNADGTVKRDVYSELHEQGVIGMYMTTGGPVIWPADEQPNPNKGKKAKDKKASSKLSTVLS